MAVLMVAHTVNGQSIKDQIIQLKYEIDTTINAPAKHNIPGVQTKKYQIFNTADAQLRKRVLDLIQNAKDSSTGSAPSGNDGNVQVKSGSSLFGSNNLNHSGTIFTLGFSGNSKMIFDISGNQTFFDANKFTVEDTTSIKVLNLDPVVGLFEFGKNTNKVSINDATSEVTIGSLSGSGIGLVGVNNAGKLSVVSGSTNVVADNHSVNLTATSSSFLVLSSPTSGSYTIGCNVTINSITASSMVARVTYRDEIGGVVIFDIIPMGAAVGTMNASGHYYFPTIELRTDGSGSITVGMLVTGATIDYNPSVTICKLHN